MAECVVYPPTLEVNTYTQFSYKKKTPNKRQMSPSERTEFVLEIQACNAPYSKIVLIFEIERNFHHLEQV